MQVWNTEIKNLQSKLGTHAHQKKERVKMYKIEIWQHEHISQEYESDDIQEVLYWYRSNWEYLYDLGCCSFSVYKDGVELSFEEENSAGFFG